jgi:hypothetical protein
MFCLKFVQIFHYLISPPFKVSSYLRRDCWTCCRYEYYT